MADEPARKHSSSPIEISDVQSAISLYNAAAQARDKIITFITY